MTENEAMKRMEMCIGISPSENIMSAFKLISEALEEVQQYRAIGTVEECRKAVERVKPVQRHHTKIINIVNDSARESICPNCLGVVITHKTEYPKFCVNCGQKIDWSVEE